VGAVVGGDVGSNTNSVLAHTSTASSFGAFLTSSAGSEGKGGGLGGGGGGGAGALGGGTQHRHYSY
jgi:hypothetical protein